MPAVKAVRAIVTGRVQGVGFRYATLSEGQQRNLTGWVRNLPSGQVEVLAQGPPATVDDFVEWLAVGPRPASVINVEVTLVEANTGLETFHVRF